MIELFKEELRRLNNEAGPYEGYWQFRKLAEMSDGNDSYFQACMERFKEFPVKTVSDEVSDSGQSSSPLLSLRELLCLREAAQDDPSYWPDIFDVFVDCDADANHLYGLRIALESIIPAIRYCYNYEQIERLFRIIQFCLSEEFDECEEAIDEIIAIMTSLKLRPESFDELKRYINQIPFKDDDYDDDYPTKLQRLREIFF